MLQETTENLKEVGAGTIVGVQGKFGLSSADAKGLKDTERAQLNKEINDTIEQRQLKESLKPDPVHWNIISKFAHKTFVPATDVSRNRGAGGGDDND